MTKNEYSIIDNYILEDDIGEGNFGKVKLCVFKKTGEKFAIKIMSKKRIEEILKDKIFQENKAIAKFHHLNIISVYQIFEDLLNIYIIMEYCQKGELFDYIVAHQKLSEEECSIFFYQIIKGVEHIHSLNYAHRDLKPENILLTDKKILKIIDFGLSREFNEEKELLNTKCGSPSYASPEVIAGEPYDGFKSDIWSCGIILYVMATGYLPFEGENNKILFNNIMKSKLYIPDSLGNDIKILLKKMLTKNPKKRISIKDIKKTEFYLKGKKLFIKKYKNILNLNKNDNKNNTDKVIKNIKEEMIPLNKNNNNKNNKDIKKEKILKNLIKFLKSKHAVFNLKSKILNINLNFNKRDKDSIKLNDNVLNTDINTLISNKISYNNSENKPFKENIKNNNKKKELNILSYSKKTKLQILRRNKINNIIPYLKTSETSPISSKLQLLGQGQTNSEKNFSLIKNKFNSYSKINSNNNDFYEVNAKSKNQRLQSKYNVDLINKLKFYPISKNTIPKDIKSKKKRENIQNITRNVGYGKNSLSSIKTHNSNNKIPFCNLNNNYSSCITTANNSRRGEENNQQLNILFTYSNNYNKKIFQKKKILYRLSTSLGKSRNDGYMKSFKTIKSTNSTKKIHQNSKEKHKLNNITVKLKDNKSFKNEYNNNKVHSIKSKIKSLKNKSIDKNIYIDNLKKINIIFSQKTSPNTPSNINRKYHNKNNLNLNSNSVKKNSSIVYLNKRNINQIINRNCAIFNTNKKPRLYIKNINNNDNGKINKSAKNSRNILSNNNSVKRYFNNRNHFSFKYLNSETGSETKCNSKKKNKKEKDIILSKIKYNLEKRNKKYITSKNSLNSFKKDKKQNCTSLDSRKLSSERMINSINCSGIETRKKEGSSLCKNPKKYAEKKNAKKNFLSNLYLKTSKNIPSDYKTLYNKVLFYKNIANK